MVLVQPDFFGVCGATTESPRRATAAVSPCFTGVPRSHASAVSVSALKGTMKKERRQRRSDMRGNLVPCGGPSIEEAL